MGKSMEKSKTEPQLNFEDKGWRNNSAERDHMQPMCDHELSLQLYWGGADPKRCSVQTTL